MLCDTVRPASTCPICGAGWRAPRGRLTHHWCELKSNILLYQIPNKVISISNTLVWLTIVTNITPIPACAILVGTLATVGAAHPFLTGLLLPNGSSQTKHWHFSFSVSFCRFNSRFHFFLRNERSRHLTAGGFVHLRCFRFKSSLYRGVG